MEVDISPTQDSLSLLHLILMAILQIRSFLQLILKLNHISLSNLIPMVEKELDAWDNRGDTPFMYRPTFAPLYTREDLEDMKTELANYDMSFVAPVSLKRQYNDDEQ
jgi:hypothetical protein